MNYEETVNVLVDRIVALGPQIMELEGPFGLFKIPGFVCEDLQPSLAQASVALGRAKARLQGAN